MINYTEEAAYIESICPSAPGHSFNDDPKCFVRYVKMQAHFAVANGRADLGARMLKHVKEKA